MMKKFFFIYCLILSASLFAKKWDAVYINKLITSGGIDKVIDYYKERYYGINRDPQDAFRIAELYVKKKEYANAMIWYDKESQLINTSKVNLFNYANTCHMMGEYQKALDAYLMYAAVTGDVNKVMDLANQCEKVLRSSVFSNSYKLENYFYNTSDDETNIAVLRTNPVYLSTKKTTQKEEIENNQLYQIVRSFENFAPPVKAYLNNLQNLKITGSSFTQDGNSVVFSARDEKTSKKGKLKQEKIYIADNLGGTYLNVRPFPFNIDGYTLKNPSFNASGTVLYFSSNQPGGKGGYDIWQSTLVNNKWTLPVNLGGLLNTAANEINPFIVQSESEEILYFSSDRLGGFGGFDIYSISKVDKVWQGTQMQPAPINSSADDISIIYDEAIKTGYFSSNRSGGKGGYDIYRFIPFNLKLHVNVKDTITDNPIDYAMVQLLDAEEVLTESVTNERGIVSFQINKDKIYSLKITKDAYRSQTIKANSIGKVSGDSVVVEVFLKPYNEYNVKMATTNTISLDKFMVFAGQLIDGATNKPASKTKMRMINYATQKVRNVEIDINGRFEITLLLNNNYKIIFETSENKLIDELTTFGLERGSVKIRNYTINNSKLKLTENKVYKQGNIPASLQLKSDFFNKKPLTTIQPNTVLINEPIRKEKIDSLIKLISADKFSETPPNNRPVKNYNKEISKNSKLILKDSILYSETVNSKQIVDDNTASSNNSNLEISSQKHKVLPNQTLYSIAKLYNIKVEDLKKWNNLNHNHIKTGQLLTLNSHPYVNEMNENKGSKSNNSIDSGTKEMQVNSEVEKHELNKITNDYSITANENISTQQASPKNNYLSIQESNKTTDEISNSTTELSKSETFSNTLELKHDVLAKQTLFIISKIYNVSVEDIKKWNELNSNNIRKGQQLIIYYPVADNIKNSKIKEEETFSADMVENTNIKKINYNEKTSNDFDVKLTQDKQDNKPTIEINLPASSAPIDKKTEPLTNKTSKDVVKDVNNNKLNVKENVQKETENIPIVQRDTNPDKMLLQNQTSAKTTADKQKPVFNKEELPEIYYKIQLASYDTNNIKFPEFEHLGYIEETRTYERYIYRIGNFGSLVHAKEVLELVRSQGYYVAFILQYNKNKITGIIK